MKHRRKIFRNATLLLGSTISPMAAAVIAPCVPQMEIVFQSVPHSNYLIKQLLTVHALFIAITAPFWGVFLDRWGRKPAVIIALALYGISGASGYFFDSLYVIFVSRFFLGIAVAGTASGFTTLIGDYYKGEMLNKYMGYQAAFIGFFSGILLTAGGILADVGWRYAFLIYLVSFVILILVLLFIYEPDVLKKAKSNSSPDSNKTFPIKKLIFVYLLAFIGMSIFYMIVILLPFHLESLNTSGTKIGLAIGICVVFAGVFSMQYSKFKEKFTFQNIFSIFFMFMSIGYFIIYIANSYYLILIGAIIVGMGTGLLIPNVNVWVTTLVSSEVRGRAIGLLTTCILVGQFFSPVMTQPIVSHVGIPKTYCIFAVICLILSAILGVVRSKD